MSASLAPRARTLHLGLTLCLALIACNSAQGPSSGESGGSGTDTGSEGSSGPAVTGGSSEGSGSGSPTEAGDDSGTSGTSNDLDSSGSESGTTGPVCQLDDDNVACDAKVDDGALPLTDRSTATRGYAGPAGLGTAPSAAPEPCDVFAQDCAEGMKCNPYADDGGQFWNANGCFPLDPAPGKAGDPCSSQGTEGPDTCEAGAFCDFDPQKGSFYCEQLCGCSPQNPTCGAGERCVQFNSGVLPICSTLCDPLAPSACAEDELCILSNYQFLCRPDGSGELGTLGDPCMYANACDPGYSCEVAPYVPGGCKEGAPNCCTPLCDLSAPDCPEGSHCLEYFGGFGLETPVCLEDVGYCIADDAP